MTYAQMWRSIPGFPGYEVSDMGNVRNLKRGRELIQHTALRGAGLYVRMGKTSRLVHKLVLLAFVGNRHQEITHLNGDRCDNRLANLMYGRRDSVPVTSRCSNGHELVAGNVEVWGKANRVCVACREGKPANRELPDVLK